MKIVVLAVPGAGKTTILKIVQKKLKNCKIVNVGDIIFDYAKKRYGVKNRDEIRKKLTLEQERKAQIYAYKKIAKLKHKILLVDTHASIKTEEGYFPGFSEVSAQILKPDALVILEFPPKDILERRKADKKRKRDIETKEEIEFHQQINRIFAAAAASQVQASLIIIRFNKPQSYAYEHANQAAEKLVRIIKRMAKANKHKAKAKQ